MITDETAAHSVTTLKHYIVFFYRLYIVSVQRAVHPYFTVHVHPISVCIPGGLYEQCIKVPEKSDSGH